MNLADMFRATLEDGERAPVLPEAAVMRLTEAAALYTEQMRGPRFQVGAWVTPRADSNLKGHGEPHIVVDIHTDAKPGWLGHNDGGCEDTRVLYLRRDTAVTAWCESFELEPWTHPAKAKPEPSDADA